MKKARAKPKKSESRWFIEPYDDFANEVVAKYFANTGRSADESVRSSYPDEYGTPHQVWEMPSYKDVSRLVSSEETSGAKFRVFSMPPGACTIHEFPFSNARNRARKSAPVRDMKKALDTLK